MASRRPSIRVGSATSFGGDAAAAAVGEAFCGFIGTSFVVGEVLTDESWIVEGIENRRKNQLGRAIVKKVIRGEQFQTGIGFGRLGARGSLIADVGSVFQGLVHIICDAGIR